MATFTIQFSVADEHMERIRYALRKHFGPVVESITDAEGNSSSVSRELTGEELLAKVRQMSINNVKAIVTSVEADEAAQAAREAVTAVVVE